MNIKKTIKSLFSGNKQDKQFLMSDSAPTKQSDINIYNNITAKGDSVSFDNANLGVQYITQVISDNPSSSSVLEAEITEKLGKIQELADECKFAEATLEYRELLEDFTMMGTVDKNIQARILLGAISSCVNQADFTNAEKYARRLQRDKLPIDEKGYSILFAFYLNQRNEALYQKAEEVAEKALEKYPNSLTCLCNYVLIKSITDRSFDAKAFFVSKAITPENEDDKKRYYETLCNIYVTRMEFDNVISTYKSLDITPSLLLHSQYINALYCDCIINTDKQFITRSDIDFSKLCFMRKSISEIEQDLSEDKTTYFRCLIADAYLNCVLLLGGNSNMVSL